MRSGKRQAALALALVLCLLLAGCSGREDEGAGPQQAYQSRAGFTARVELTGQLDAGRRGVHGGVCLSRQGEDTQTIVAPEAVAGVTMTLSDGEEGVRIRYAGTELETAMPRRPGLTPADGIYALMETLVNDYPVSRGEETWQDTPVTRLSYRGERDGARSGTKCCWRKTGACVMPRCTGTARACCKWRWRNFNGHSRQRTQSHLGHGGFGPAG